VVEHLHQQQYTEELDEKTGMYAKEEVLSLS
jgi:hypothetical protein